MKKITVNEFLCWNCFVISCVMIVHSIDISNFSGSLPESEVVTKITSQISSFLVIVIGVELVNGYDC